jgi:acyl-CoA thioester hydrolase
MEMNQLEVTYRGTVYPWHCDHMGHMNVMWYTGKFDEASWSLLASFGLTSKFLKEHDRGLAALQQNITYKRELVAGDIVSIRSGVLSVENKVVRIFHEMQNEETHEVSAFSTITGVYMDTRTRKSVPFSADVAEGINAVVLDESKLYWAETLPAIPKPRSLG